MTQRENPSIRSLSRLAGAAAVARGLKPETAGAGKSAQWTAAG